MVLAAAGTAGCMEFWPGPLADRVGDQTLKLLKSPTKLIPCSRVVEDSAQFVDSPAITRWVHDGGKRPRLEVAVLYVRSIQTHQAAMTIVYANALDGRTEVSEQPPDRHTRLPLEASRCVVQDCFRVAILPGIHALTLHAVSDEAGRRTSRIDGAAQFAAQAGGLYSVQACQATANQRPLFWVRDEKSQKCVSNLCPSE